MIHLALTVASFLFLCAVGIGVIWGALLLIGFLAAWGEQRRIRGIPPPGWGRYVIFLGIFLTAVIGAALSG